MRKKMSKNILEASLEGADTSYCLVTSIRTGTVSERLWDWLNYLRENYPQIEAELFLDHPAAKFSYMNDFEKILPRLCRKNSLICALRWMPATNERLGWLRGLF